MLIWMTIDPLWSRVQVRQAYWPSIQNVNTPIARVCVRVPNFSLKIRNQHFQFISSKIKFSMYFLLTQLDIHKKRNEKKMLVKIFIFHHLIAKYAKNKQKTMHIFYFTTAIFWAITFGNPSIDDEMSLI